MIRSPVATGFEPVAGGLHARYAAGAARQHEPLDVVVPARADGDLRLSDPRHSVTIRFRMLGAGPAPAEPAGGYALYRRAFAGQYDVVHRPTPTGTEDFIAFETAPADAVVRYELSLDDGVAGLRLVADTLELLDGEGTPRLRMARPYLVDAIGARYAATVSIEGCGVDTSPAPPWGRSVVKPGASTCTVGIDWSEAGLTYPALLDPSWTYTTNPADLHGGGSAIRLADGRVFVIGQWWPPPPQIPGLVEIFDPPTETWATAGTTPTIIHGVGLNLLPDGTVLVSGGIEWDDDPDTIGLSWYWSQDSSRYDPTTGIFSPVNFNRAGHAAVSLSDGSVLLIGGETLFQNTITPSLQSHLFDPTTGNVTLAGTLNSPHVDADAVRAPDGSVLVADATSGMERWDPSTQTWSVVSAPPADFDGLAVTPQGLVVAPLFPGVDMPGGLVSYDLVADAWVPVTGAPTNVHALGPVLANGQMMTFFRAESPVTKTDVSHYDPVSMTLAPLPPLLGNHWSSFPPFKRTPYVELLDGRVMIPTYSPPRILQMGPGSAGGTCLTASDCLSGNCVNNLCIGALGDLCSTHSGCASSYCIDGVCCATSCAWGADDCMGCSNAQTGAADGVCAPLLAGSVCRATANECDAPEVCDGVATQCPADGYAPDGTSCGGASATACSDPDSCLGGVCQANDLSFGSPCGDQNVLCVINDVCDGNGACLDNGFASTTVACRPATGGCDTIEYCDGLGSCPPDGVESAGSSGTGCAPYWCDGVNASCPTTCTGDGDCFVSHWCDAGACVPLQGNGAACTAANQCVSTFCVDGVCCDAACSGLCEACVAASTAGSDGQCAAVVSGTDPDDECVDGTCGPGNTCLIDQGVMCTADAECGTGFCVDGVCCDEACTGTCRSCALPGMEGVCSFVPAGADPDVECAGKVCNGMGLCRSSNGTICDGDDECVSGHCVDGLCCDTACDGGASDCQACDVAGSEGSCAPLAAGAVCRVAAAACDAEELCDGVATACPPDAAAPNGTPCEGGTCTNATCSPDGEPVDEGSGCSTAARGSSHGSDTAWWLGSLAALALLRRRRDRLATTRGCRTS